MQRTLPWRRIFSNTSVQPKVNGEYLKVGLGRNAPPMPSIVKADPWWLADPHRKAYTEQALLGPTLPQYWVFNPA